MSTKLTKLSRQAVEAALDEFVRIGRDAFLEKYRFGKARDFFVIHPVTGEACDSKAVVGAAYGMQYPQEGPLSHDVFSGGVATVVKLLRQLGFELSDSQAAATSPSDRAWSRHENELIVADYLDMLLRELAGQKFN